jgi:eukaryotic-like serine/threonine-protein kinase
MQDISEILFEKFRISACLKKDTHNAVYMADHIYLGKKIILKTLNTLELPDKIVLERFKREARILALLDHPNLIKVLDFGTYGDHFYISFEYFDSSNLRTVLNDKKLSYDQKHHLLVQLLKALNIAHQNNIVHRDIKPENILVNSNYELKIADFGLAIALNDTALTNKSSIVGTPGYMSPEQIKGDKISTQSDIFSAGIVALELFTGSNPFIGKNINETINNILSFREDSISDKIAPLSPAVQQSILMMLKKNPLERGRNINELLSLLGVAGEIFTPVEVKIKKLKKRHAVLISSFMLSAFITLFLIYIFSSEEVVPQYSFGNAELMIFNNNDKTDSVAEEDTLKTGLLTDENQPANVPGKLMVKADPGSDIYINNRKVNTTPIRDYINLAPGSYNVKLIHPDFPEYKRRITVASNRIQNIDISFKEMAGFLNCEIYPWGEIFIDDEKISITPLRENIMLMPGKYKLTIKNPRFGSISETITIKSKEINVFRYNFENKN